MKKLLVLSVFSVCVAGLSACQPDPIIVEVESVVVNPPGVTMHVGETKILYETVYPENATDKSVEWSSENPAIVTVSEGVITGIAPGLSGVVVTTRSGGKTARCRVAVLDNSGIKPAGL